jgi:hypothetical protein
VKLEDENPTIGIVVCYWESKDPVELKRRIEELGSIIMGFGSALESALMDAVLDQDSPEALAAFVERVAQDFQRRGAC